MAPARTIDSTRPDTNQLRSEISKARRRGIAKIETKDPRIASLDLPLLVELAEQYAPGKLPTEAIKSLISEAIKRLPDGLTTSTALRLFGLDRQFYEPQPAQWRTEACAMHPMMSVEHFRKSIETNILAHLAIEVFGLVEDAAAEEQLAGSSVNGATQASGVAGFITRYVWRPEYAETFARLIAQGHDTIVLVGQPGMGKSRLADDLVYSHASSPEEVMWIRKRTPRTYLRDLRNACAQRGIVVEAGVIDEPKVLLQTLVQDAHAPEFVVLDAVDRADDLAWMLPTAMRSTVVTVSWAKTTPLKRCGVIRVGHLTDDQSAELLTVLSPQLTESDREMLLTCLYGHPAVIANVCVLINSGTIAPGAVHAALTLGAPEFLSRVHIGRKHTLGDGLTAVTADLEAYDPLAAEILACLAALPVTQDQPVPVEFVHAYARAARLTTGSPAEVPLLCGHAIRSLKDFRLVSSRPGIGLTIHPLTHAVLRGIYAPLMNDVTKNLRDTNEYL